MIWCLPGANHTRVILSSTTLFHTVVPWRFFAKFLHFATKCFSLWGQQWNNPQSPLTLIGGSRQMILGFLSMSQALCFNFRRSFDVLGEFSLGVFCLDACYCPGGISRGVVCVWMANKLRLMKSKAAIRVLKEGKLEAKEDIYLPPHISWK